MSKSTDRSRSHAVVSTQSPLGDPGFIHRFSIAQLYVIEMQAIAAAEMKKHGLKNGSVICGNCVITGDPSNPDTIHIQGGAKTSGSRLHLVAHGK